MTGKIGATSGQQARQAGTLLREMLSTRPAYRTKWQSHSTRIGVGRLNQAAIARVIALHLWDAGERADSETELARTLKDRVARALSGTSLTQETLSWFVDAFSFTALDVTRIYRALGCEPGLIDGVLRESPRLVVPQRHRTVALFEAFSISATRASISRRTNQVIIAQHEPVDVYPYVYRREARRVLVLRGGRAGAVSEFGRNHRVMATRLDALLSPGDSASLEHLASYAAAGAPESLRRLVLGRAENLDLSVTFADRLPSRIWRVSWDSAESGKEVLREELAVRRSVSYFVPTAERVALGFQFEW